ADLNDLLLINIEEVLSRRLQTVILKKGLARSVHQARQFIIHGHISMGSRRLTVPGYMVRIGEDESIAYTGNSPLSSDMHPMRPAPDFVGVLKEKRPERDEGRNSKYSRRPAAVPKAVEKVVKKEIKKEVVPIKEVVEEVVEKEEPLPDVDTNGTEEQK
ncbi:MAG: 30S ribosomal protein S4, partial [Candidatus Thermoplasmatota archaeon]|nr:30S ribosomal protein S4 [Candidatus Thermoplasmatota archaeon]